MTVSKSIVLHFPSRLVDRPIVSRLVRDFNLDFNILKASVTPEEEGLLVLDVLAPDGKTLPWCGKGTRKVDMHTKPEKKTKHIQAVVEKILKQFPPTAK